MTIAKKSGLTEEQSVSILRNALIAAGLDMGEEGEHWPVINATVKDIADEYEDLKRNRAVFAEMKKHLYAELEVMEAAVKELPTEAERQSTIKTLKELREIYDAHFSDVNDEELVLVDAPFYMKRADEILKTLEEEPENE